MKITNLSTALFLGFSLFFSQCSTPETNIKYYFDVQTQIENKVSSIKQEPHKVIKSVSINGQKDESTLQIKDWEKELAMFLNLNLNLPALQGKYEESDSSSAEKKYKIYTAIDRDVSIRYLRIELDLKDTTQLIGLYTELSEKNYLYQTAQTLQLICSEEEKSRGSIKSYQIDGYEKILFQNKEQYSIKGSIID